MLNELNKLKNLNFFLINKMNKYFHYLFINMSTYILDCRYLNNSTFIQSSKLNMLYKVKICFINKSAITFKILSNV